MTIPASAYPICAALADTTAGAPLSAYTTFRIGGPASLLCLPETTEQLKNLLAACKTEQYPILMLGAGSNLLVADEGLDAVVIATERLNDIAVEGNTIRAEAGVSLTALCRKAAEAGLSGLEFAFGIPGSVGGGVYMNAGAYGGELKDVLTEVEYLDEDGNLHIIPAAECDFSYRHSRFQSENTVITAATFTLTPDAPEIIQSRMQEIIGKRRDKQPLSYPSAGSAFKRPQGAFAAALIEQCGLKGYSVGDAQVSEKHAGFIINKGNASCTDTCKLFCEVRRIVKEKTGYDLVPEVKLLGRDWE